MEVPKVRWEDVEAKNITMKHFHQALEETPSSVHPNVMKFYEQMRGGFKKRADAIREAPEVR